MRESEYNRELLVLAYLEQPSPALLAEILSAFDPICRANAKRWISALADRDDFDDCLQDARIKTIAVLGQYKPRGASFERLLAFSLRTYFLNRVRRADCVARHSGPMPEELDVAE